MSKDTSHQRRIATEELGELSNAAIDRIADRVAERAPGIARRTRRVRAATHVGAAGAGLLLTVLLGSWLGQGARGPEPALSLAQRARRCQAFAMPALERRDDGLLGLGGLATVDTTGGQIEVSELGLCSNRLRLSQGRVLVHAIDLGGGELIIEAGSGRVTVVGTLFVVERSGDDGFLVEVREGIVRVDNAAGQVATIGAGGRAQVSAQHITPSSLRVEPLPSEIDSGEAPEEEGPVTKTTRVREPKREPLSGPSEESVEQLVRRATERRQKGDLAGARQLFRQAGSMSGATAEAAWISLARLELSDAQPGAALSALAERRQRFGEGALSVEAAWLSVAAHDQSGESAKARAVAEEIRVRWPNSLQAEAAGRWLLEHPR